VNDVWIHGDYAVVGDLARLYNPKGDLVGMGIVTEASPCHNESAYHGESAYYGLLRLSCFPEHLVKTTHVRVYRPDWDYDEEMASHG
jgi:hypothetical protein